MLSNIAKHKILPLVALTTLATVLSYLFLDAKIALFIQAHFFAHMIALSSFLSYPLEPLILPLYILTALNLARPSFITQLINFGGATVTTIALVSLLKVTLCRPRPHYFLTHSLLELQPFKFNPQWVSMPSGHAAAAGLIASFLWMHLKGKKRLFILIPITLALFRTLCLKHFLSDVILGFGIGATLGLFFCSSNNMIFQFLKEKLWKNGKTA